MSNLWILVDGGPVLKQDTTPESLAASGYDGLYCLEGDTEWRTVTPPAPAPAPVPAPAPAPAPAMAKSYWYLDQIRKPVQGTREEIQKLVDQGYTEALCPVGETAWATPSALGFTRTASRDLQLATVTDPVQVPVNHLFRPPFEIGVVVLDTETGGLHPESNPLLSCSLLIVSPDLYEVDGVCSRFKPPIGTLLELVRPEDRYVGNKRGQRIAWVDVYTNQQYEPDDPIVHTRPLITAYAAEINGYTGQTAWSWDAVQAWNQTGEQLEITDAHLAGTVKQFYTNRPVAVAHNTDFDEKYVRQHLPRLYARLNPVWGCTYRAFQALRLKMGMKNVAGSCTLASLSKTAGYEPDGRHEALEDARACLMGLRWLRQTARAQGLELTGFPRMS